MEYFSQGPIGLTARVRPRVPHRQEIFLSRPTTKLVISLLAGNQPFPRAPTSGNGRRPLPPPGRRPHCLHHHRRHIPGHLYPTQRPFLSHWGHSPPLPPPRRGRVISLAAPRFLDPSALLQVGGGHGRPPRARGRRRGVPCGGRRLLRRHTGQSVGKVTVTTSFPFCIQW